MILLENSSVIERNIIYLEDLKFHKANSSDFFDRLHEKVLISSNLVDISFSIEDLPNEFFINKASFIKGQVETLQLLGLLSNTDIDFSFNNKSLY